MHKHFYKKACSLALALAFTATSVSFGFTSKDSSNDVHAATACINPFPLSEITMTDPYCTNAFQKEVSYLLAFDTNRLLAGFRENAGLNTYNAKRYDGWENCLIGGHTLGHYLTACAQAYHNPLLTKTQKEQLYTKIKNIVDGLLTCQQNTKGKYGFIWAAPKKSTNVEWQFDNVENGKTNIITESWVPWYTMHKIIAGLIDVYKLTGYNNAKEVSSRLGDWTYNRCRSWTPQKHNTVLSIEYGGMNDCLYELYNITKKESHAIAAHYFDETTLFNRVQSKNTNSLNNLHANTTIPKFIGALKRYTLLNGKTVEGTTVNATDYLKYAETFWDTVVTRHTYITGGNSEWEHFGEDYKLDGERTNCNCETCNTYNMLKLSRELFQITGNVKYMHYYEKAYYNSILSSQNPETGMTTYFQPMASGYFKVYSSPFNSFWCCTGSGMENMTKLGDTIYMSKDNTLYVNLYQSSTLSWTAQDVTISQTSSIPETNNATFKLTTKKSADLNLRFRIPDWCTGKMNITKNGVAVSYTNINGYAQISGTFSNNDIITVTIPASVIAHSLPDNSNSYAFTYGPLALSAELGTANMTQTTTGMNVSIPAKKEIANETVTINAANGSVSSFMKNINKYLVKAPSSLTFTLTGTNQNLTFTPHYLQHKQRYALYLYYKSNGTSSIDPAEQASTEITDTVQPGYGQYEFDDLHAMRDNNSVGVTSDGTYRYAKAGGSFTYRMAVDKDAKFKILVVTLRKADNGKSLKIKVGNTILFAKTLRYEGTKDSYPIKIMIPDYLIADNVKPVTVDGTAYDIVPITFASNDSSPSARICDFVYMTAVTPNYSVDTNLAYYVNCGDHNVTTASGSDKFGLYNSLTEQLYGEDAITGYTWGLMDDKEDQYHGSSNSAGIYTANTWPDERNTGDDVNKASSFRYTKNQYEHNIARHLDYGFTMPNGTYTIEIGLNNPWNCSNYPTIYTNYGTAKQSTIASKVPVNGSAVVRGTVKVTDGTLTVNARSEDKAINMTYLIITCQSLEPLPIENSSETEPSTQPSKVPVTLADGSYYIRSVCADKYLQVADGKASAAQNVEIGTGKNADYQKWYLKNHEDGTITLKSALGNFNLDISGGSTEDGANVQIYNAYDGVAQKFVLEQAGTEHSYVITTVSSKQTKAIDVSAFGKTDGTNVCQWSLTGGSNQKWIFEPADTLYASPVPSVEPSLPAPSETVPSKAPAPTPQSDFDFQYKVLSDWGSGWQAELVITNNSKETLNGWTLSFDYNSTIANLWGAEFASQSGKTVTITNPSWDSSLAPGASVTINFIANGSDKSAPAKYSIS